MKLEVETGLVNALLKFNYQITSIRSETGKFVTGYTFTQNKLNM